MGCSSWSAGASWTYVLSARAPRSRVRRVDRSRAWRGTVEWSPAPHPVRSRGGVSGPGPGPAPRTRLDRISIDPAVLLGQPTVRGTRMRVSDVLSLLAAGADANEIVRDYPYLTVEDVQACLAYAAQR